MQDKSCTQIEKILNLIAVKLEFGSNEKFFQLDLASFQNLPGLVSNFIKFRIIRAD